VSDTTVRRWEEEKLSLVFLPVDPYFFSRSPHRRPYITIDVVSRPCVKTHSKLTCLVCTFNFLFTAADQGCFQTNPLFTLFLPLPQERHLPHQQQPHKFQRLFLPLHPPRPLFLHTETGLSTAGAIHLFLDPWSQTEVQQT
jgi:hypothetical protein